VGQFCALSTKWEPKLLEVERGQLDARRFMAEIVAYTGEVIRCGDACQSTSGRSATARVAASTWSQENKFSVPVLRTPFCPCVFCVTVDRDTPGIPQVLNVNDVEVAGRAG